MKKVLTSFLLIFSLWANGQKDSTEIEILTAPDSTAIGKPDGKPASQEIGASGGRIISADGRVELIFPAGALTETKTIQIQPTTNHAPNGAGKSYWFEPSGIQFTKPVQINFHYSDEEAETCPPELMVLAIQAKTGKWSFVEYDEVDTVSKTLKGLIHHFTGGANAYKLMLEADKTELLVKESAEIRIWRYYKAFDVKIESMRPKDQPVLWYVNGVEWGNSSTGKILYVLGEPDTKPGFLKQMAGYQAPEFILKKNPVTISVDLYVSSGKAKVYKRATTLRCKILICDGYKITVNYTTDFPGANGTELTDTSSFFVWVFPDRVIIEDIKNYVPYISKQGKGPCTLIIYTAGYNGYLHLSDEYWNFQLSNHSPPEVLFDFPPMREARIFQYKWICKKFPPSPIDVLIGTPISPEINFIANGLTQRINFNKYGTIYKITVVPYRPL